MSKTSTQSLVSTLWNDKQSRSVIFQIITIVLLFAFVFFIVNNAITNLNALGKDYSFDFLFTTASYDINQSLIAYNSQDTHFRAAVVGLLNTLLVAVFGIILSTVLGFFLGVFRLSKNWLINRIVYVYVEFVRNVPLLLQILLVHGIIVNTLPVPKQAVNISDVVFLSNRGFYTPKPVFEPIIWMVVVAFFIAVAFVIWFKRRARKVQDETGKIYPVFWVSVAAIFGFPFIVFFLVGAPMSLDIPELKGFNFKGGMVLKPEFLSLWLALSLYTAAFIAEIVRAGIQAISKGQSEAASALGIKPNRVMQLVIIPQALRVIIPPLTSQYLNITKNSSLAIAIGYMDIVATLGGISLNQTGREMESMTIVLMLYLIFSLTISSVMNWFNNRIKLVER